MTQRQFILIGGAPTTGKSTVAQKLSEKLDIPWISTDQIREIAKPYCTKETHPNLHHAGGLSAEEFLAKYTPQQVSDMEFDQGVDVWAGVKGMLTIHYDWPRGGIIEGVNILPSLVAQDDYEGKELVKAVFLIDLDEDRMREVIYTRGLYDDADKYSDDVKELEVEWAMIFAKRLKAEAEKHNLPYVEITKTEDDIPKILKVLKV